MTRATSIVPPFSVTNDMNESSLSVVGIIDELTLRQLNVRKMTDQVHAEQLSVS